MISWSAGLLNRDLSKKVSSYVKVQWAKSQIQTIPMQRPQDGNKIGMRKARVKHSSAKDSMQGN